MEESEVISRELSPICRSRAGTIKTIQRLPKTAIEHDAEKRRKNIRHYILYIIVISLFTMGILIPVIFFATRKPPIYHVSHPATSKPVTMSGRTTTMGPITTTQKPFDQCERNFVALTKQMNASVTLLDVADLNHDDKIDIVFICDSLSYIYILFNLGNEMFTDPRQYATTVSVSSMIITDINADSHLDIIVALALSDFSLKIYFNDGSGIFDKTFSVERNDAMEASSIAVVDMNDDGRFDIIVSIAFSNIIGIYFRKLDQTFDQMKTYFLEKFPISVYAVDLNGDKKPDVIVANAKSNEINILFNQGDGSLSSPTNYSVGTGPIFVTAADLNHDKKSDIIVVNYFSNNIMIFLNNGASVFTAHTNLSGQANPISIALSDYDSDGSIDIIVPNHHTNNVEVFFNNRSGMFRRSTVYYTYPLPRLAVAADLNNDNKPDIVLGNGKYVTAILSRCG